MVFCVVLGCNSRTSHKTKHQVEFEKEKKITFHRFPKNEHRRQVWCEALGRKNWMPNNRSCLCSLRFTEDCFDKTSVSSVRLRDYAIPTKFKDKRSLEAVTETIMETQEWNLEVAGITPLSQLMTANLSETDITS